MAESKSSSRIFLVSSLVLGVLAMVAAFIYLENSGGRDKGPQDKILVASHDLRENTALDPDKDLKEIEVPAKLEELRLRALSAKDKTAYKGQRINRPILAGTPVMFADLAAPASIELKGDTRALSIAVKGANAMTGLVAPGDLVKLMVTRPATTPAPRAPTTSPTEFVLPDSRQPTRWETVLIAPNAFRVLAVNQRTTRIRSQGASEAYQSAGEGSNQTVTLEVTEAQAKTILEQTGAGQLAVTLILCPPNTATGG